MQIFLNTGLVLLDLSKESATTLEAYGRNRPEPKGIGGRGKSGETYKDFARNCLLARRLAERDVRFIQLFHMGWDHHSKISENLPKLCRSSDQATAGLLLDLKRRGLLEDTLVVWGGEFGRMPFSEGKNAPGRNHNPYGFCMWMAGGGIKGGMTYGSTDELGYNAAENIVEIHDLHATMQHLLGIDHQQLTYRYRGRDFRLTDVAGHVVEPILS